MARVGGAVEYPWAERRRALRAVLDRARDFTHRIEEGRAASASEVARQEGISRARVSQIMGLLRLAPRGLADLEAVDREAPMLQEKVLRRIAALGAAQEQVAEYQRLLAEEAEPETAGRPAGRVRRRGLQHVLAQARAYAAALESGEARSYAELGRREGITGARVAQIVLLLHLEPEILAAVDVPADQLPTGVSERKLRKVARVKGREGQLGVWGELIGEQGSREGGEW